MNQNDLNNTQVLNMDDVEEMAKYEKSKSRRPAIMLAFAGIFAIAMGFVQPMIMSALDGDEASANQEEVEDSGAADEDATDGAATTTGDSLACTYTAVASAEGIDTTATINFNFSDSKLQGFTKNVSIIPSTGNETLGATTINTLLATYQNVMATTLNGYVLTAQAEGTGINGSLTVDLNTLDKTTLPVDYSANILTSANYDKDATLDAVKAAALAEGYTCQ